MKCKKLAVLFLAFVMLLSMAACGAKPAETPTTAAGSRGADAPDISPWRRGRNSGVSGEKSGYDGDHIHYAGSHAGL